MRLVQFQTAQLRLEPMQWRIARSAPDLSPVCARSAPGRVEDMRVARRDAPVEDTVVVRADELLSALRARIATLLSFPTHLVLSPARSTLCTLSPCALYTLLPYPSVLIPFALYTLYTFPPRALHATAISPALPTLFSSPTQLVLLSFPSGFSAPSIKKSYHACPLYPSPSNPLVPCTLNQVILPRSSPAPSTK